MRTGVAGSHTDRNGSNHVSEDNPPSRPVAYTRAMRRWIAPVFLVLVAGFAAFQAVESDRALAETPSVEGNTEPALTTPLLSIRRTPEFLRAPILEDNLVIALDEVATTFPSQSCLAVSIDGDEVFGDNPTLPLVPASTQKLLTAYGVYELLGGGRTYTTDIVTDATISDGVLDGNLVLVGGGDPLLATAAYTDRYEQQPHFRTPIEELADAVVAAGITEINGAVIGDESRYDTVRFVPEWPVRFTSAEQNQTGPLSALTVNDAFVSFDASNTANSLSTAASDPAAFAAAFFDDLLEERGLIIRQSAAAGEAPVGARTIASVTSDPISVVTNQMVDISDNHGAELLLKEIGLEAFGRGTTNDGALAIENLLRERGFSIQETDVVDGSGLASENRLNCRLLLEVLNDSVGTPLHDGLAVAGESGTLRERFIGTDAVGRVQAKTGRLNEVGALAGTVEASDGTEITFAWIANTTDILPVEEMIAMQDAVVFALLDYPQGPDVDALGPTQ